MTQDRDLELTRSADCVVAEIDAIIARLVGIRAEIDAKITRFVAFKAEFAELTSVVVELARGLVVAEIEDELAEIDRAERG